MNAGRIDEYDLSIGTSDDTLNAKASGLWLVGNGRNLLPDEPIEERRFAGIGPPDERYITAAEVGLGLELF